MGEEERGEYACQLNRMSESWCLPTDSRAARSGKVGQEHYRGISVSEISRAEEFKRRQGRTLLSRNMRRRSVVSLIPRQSVESPVRD
jgi:hypothetical protein